MIRLRYLFVIGLLGLFGCDDDNPDLLPIEQRVETAISNLRNELTAPPNGWRVDYQPTNEAGTFLIIMDFDENGEVNIQSDVPDNDGQFLNQTIPYRIDNSLGLELVLETFAVFHYLFELESAEFGAEFEFFYQGKSGDTLLFESKSDVIDKTILEFLPADVSDFNSFSADLAANLNEFQDVGPQLFGTNLPTQQVSLLDANVSVFWSLNLNERNVTVEFAAVGTTPEEIVANPGAIRFINHETTFGLENGRMVFEEPFSFVINNTFFEFSEISFGDFENSGPSICPFGEDTNPIFQEQDGIFGDVTIQNSAISTSGLGFTQDVYSVNADFFFDGEQNSLNDEGGLFDVTFSNVSGFVVVYGVLVNLEGVPEYSLGVILEDGGIYLREFEPTTTGINQVQINLLDEYFVLPPEDGSAPVDVEQTLETVTDELFSGGEVYAYFIPVEGIELYNLFNPCNGYEMILVK